MTMALRPYAGTKDTGVPWVGVAPAHWDILPLKRIGKFQAGSGFPISEQGKDGEDVLFAKVADMNLPGNEREIVSASNTVSHEVAGLLGARIFERGTIVFPKVGGALLTNKRRLLARETCIDNNLMSCIVAGADIDFAFRVLSWLDLGRLAKPGPVPAISEGEVREIRIALPTVSEQAAIARFLDHMDRRIQKYIRAKEKLIALLDEYKQALVHQAVTGQIDVRTGRPYGEYKESGVKWLGRVPGHWRVLPLKRAFSAMEYGISEPATDGGQIALLTMGHVSDGEVTIPPHGGVKSVNPSLLLQDEDLLFNRTNSAELVGKVGRYRAAQRPSTFASYLVRMRPSKKNVPQFLNLLLNDIGFLASARREAIPSLHQSNLNPTRYGRLPIVLPPKAEQAVIVNSIERQRSGLDSVDAATRREIDMLNEYRTRLIADVVTGKLDVCEAAAGLPEHESFAEAAANDVNSFE